MSIKSIVERSAPLYATTEAGAELETECIYGEQFEVLKTKDDYSFGKLLTDGYEGWLLTSNLGDLPVATHRVVAPATWVRDDISIKSYSEVQLSIGSLITISEQADDICTIVLKDANGYLPASHVVPMSTPQVDLPQDWVETAELFIGAPYHWGGRTSSGLDCSALVQLSAQTAGFNLPRNTSQQQHVGKTVASVDDLQRGDLVFWKGHVGVMQSNTQLLHANAYHMKVTSELLSEAITRIAEKEGPVTALKRLSQAH